MPVDRLNDSKIYDMADYNIALWIHIIIKCTISPYPPHIIIIYIIFYNYIIIYHKHII